MALPPQNEFELARKRAQQQETANLQGQKDALARRAAQTGGGVNGALMKQENIAADQSAQRLQTANEGIDTAERVEERRRAELEAGRQFAREERLGSQEFQSGEAGKGRSFATSERLGGQDFAAGQAGQQRSFLTGERLGGQQFQAGETALERKLRLAMQGDQQAFGERMFGLQRDADTSARADTQAFNERMFGLNRDATDAARQDTQAFAERMFGLQSGAEEAARLDTQAFQERLFGLGRDADWAKLEAQLGLSKEQFTQQFEHQKYIDGENLIIAKQMLNEKDFMEKLLSPESVADVPVLGTVYSKVTGSGGGGGRNTNILDSILKFGA